MAFDYVSMRQKGTNLLIKFGTLAYLNRYESTSVYTKSYDAMKRQTKWVNTSTGIAQYTEPVGSLKKYEYNSVVSAYSIREIDGVNILATDKKIILSYSVVTPVIGEYLSINSIKYKIINVEVVSPASDTLLYKVQARI